MPKKIIRIGTRRSQLAMKQALWVKEKILLYSQSACGIEIVKITTKGDKIVDVPLAKVGGKGLFVKELEEALLANHIDIAVHSMKDVPALLPQGLTIAVVTKREDPRDVLISKDNIPIYKLKDNAVIGTSSLRRSAQLLHFNPSFNIRQLRGNINTRLTKLAEGGLDGVILASAGMLRMGWADKITEYIPYNIILPAVGQGALGIETRIKDGDLIEFLKPLNHKETFIAILAERGFLKRLEGGCQVPIACNGVIKDNSLFLDGLISSLDGRQIIRKDISTDINNPENTGIQLAEELLKMGGDHILKEIYENM